jgi:CheY-like chemotaxis protein
METPSDLWPLVEAAAQEARGTPIIGCSVPRTIEHALEAGAQGYLVKPVTRADLEKALRTVGEPAKRVLVVDDDPAVLDLFSRMLRVHDSALEVVTASSGEQALRELRRALPDLMLLDVLMPGMDGLEVLAEMQKDERIRGVPTLCVSAQDPLHRPPVSRLLVVTMDEGLPLGKLLTCSLQVSSLLLAPEAAPDLTLG